MTARPSVIIIGADTFRARAYAAAIECANIGPVAGLFYGPNAPRKEKMSGEGRTIGELRLPRLNNSVFTIFERNGWPYRRLAAEKINDPECVSALRESGAALAIFAGRGGEIVSAEVLSQGVPLLHMHPGKLPEQRGSTTLYYSILEGKSCSVSALLMAAEIDAGPVVALNNYPLPPSDVDVDVVFDCAVRADTLIGVLRHLNRTGSLPCVSRDPGEDRLYFVVHPVLKHLALLSRQHATEEIGNEHQPHRGTQFIEGKNMPVLSTKAATLDSLVGKLKTAKIAPIYRFAVAMWHDDAEDIVRTLQSKFGGQALIVRSSCQNEDAVTHSNAGAYLTLQNVESACVAEAIEQVIASYSHGMPDDEVLIQPMLHDVIRSGVAFTHDPNTCAPYRIVNWSEGTDTTAITSGLSGRTWQSAAESPLPPPATLAQVVALLEELSGLFSNTPLDCEFAMTREGEKEVLWLLQVRPLVLTAASETAAQLSVRLKIIEEKIERGMFQHPFLMGKRTVYGVMPDWNPAEIIGIRPKPLSLSLYRDLVTDSIWAYQRHNYGYRNLRSHPLMLHFYGLPYIDVRVSFNSFIPDDLDDGLAGRLVDHYIDSLLAEPKLHDKVEFDIVYSCYTLDLPQRLERLAQAGFSTDERTRIADSLRQLTNRIIHPREGLWRIDAAKMETLNARREQLLASSADPLARIYWLLEDGRRYGTLPFAGLARAGFVAVQMLQSLVAVGVLSTEDYDAFMGSVSTVSGQLSRDRAMLDQATFLARYGHLRPGTYDVLSPRYDEAPDLYFDWAAKPAVPSAPRPFQLTLNQMREIVGLLEIHALHPDVVGLFDFLQLGVELRELSKFHFTRNLSDALSLAAEFGERHGFSRDDMAYCDIGSLKELHVAAADPKDLLARAIEQGRARYDITKTLALPPLIVHPQDVWAYEWPETLPNFITQKQVTAPVVACKARDKLAGAIVCIPNADPGFDWLFSHPIAGLVTAWGGANSHMAIRAGELGLPAVIGVGEMHYREWSTARRLNLDCAGRRVEVLS